MKTSGFPKDLFPSIINKFKSIREGYKNLDGGPSPDYMAMEKL